MLPIAFAKHWRENSGEETRDGKLHIQTRPLAEGGRGDKGEGERGRRQRTYYFVFRQLGFSIIKNSKIT